MDRSTRIRQHLGLVEQRITELRERLAPLQAALHEWEVLHLALQQAWRREELARAWGRRKAREST